MKLVLREIGLQSTAKKAIEPLIGLNEADLVAVFGYIREKLTVTLDWQKRTEAYRVLEQIGAIQNG